MGHIQLVLKGDTNVRTSMYAKGPPPQYYLDVIHVRPVKTHENPSAKNLCSFRMFDTFQ